MRSRRCVSSTGKSWSRSSVNEINDVIERLTINTRSQNNPDAFIQNLSTGITNVNLRGLGVGATNLFDKAPPRVATNGGYDSKVHDPRGRLLYARALYSFW